MDHRLIRVRPSPRQLQLQRMEFYAFVHFTVNTFTGKEWGDGTEDPSIFNPKELDAGQWVRSVRSAGMTGLILTCKHHDGFCLWPSKFTRHSVAASPFRGGHGDVVAEVSAACREQGIAFGVYLSPWDRNHPLYGSGKAYDDYFVAQLQELLTGYGDIFCVWLDGACGEGPNGKRQCYDWDRYYHTVRDLQPNATIHVCGPDIRWCGNEAGDTRPSEWSVVPRRTADTEKIASASQQQDDAAFRRRKISARDQDLGSRFILQDEQDLIWYPAEVNTSIRPGWFYHEAEDNSLKPLEKLIRIYENSVGGNATFLLNIPPTPAGLFHWNDVALLEAFGAYLRESYSTNLLQDAVLSADPAAAGCPIDSIRNNDETFYLPLAETGQAEITLHWESPRTFRRIVLQEQLQMSQRVESFSIEILIGSQWQHLHSGTVVGSKRILTFPVVTAEAVRIRINDARVAPTLRFLGIYS